MREKYLGDLAHLETTNVALALSTSTFKHQILKRIYVILIPNIHYSVTLYSQILERVLVRFPRSPGHSVMLDRTRWDINTASIL